jgi:hypothetical protein
MQAACAYAVIQFRPFVETGEFANVGMVMLGTEQRFFDFLLLKKYSRITRFFPELDRKVYLAAMANFREELERVRAYIRREALDGRRAVPDTALAQRIFAELTRTREGLLRFDAPRLVLADVPAAKLKTLFDHYVGRNFVTREYQERLLENGIARLLYNARLPFGPDKIGNEDFAVRFPFVRKQDDQVVGVIKPLFLAQEDSTHILTKGDGWVSKIKRLKRQNQLPEHVLFALNGPAPEAERRHRAFLEIQADLADQGVTTLQAGNEEGILAFAGALN